MNKSKLDEWEDNLYPSLPIPNAKQGALHLLEVAREWCEKHRIAKSVEQALYQQGAWELKEHLEQYCGQGEGEE